MLYAKFTFDVILIVSHSQWIQWVRQMIMGGSEWKYVDDKCRCGLVETEKYVLFECTSMMEKGL